MLNLKDAFHLARAYVRPNTHSMPDTLARVFSAEAMSKYDGERDIMPPLLKRVGFPNIVVVTNPDKIKSVLMQKSQLRPAVVSRAVEMVDGVPNIFTADQKDVWLKYRRPMMDFLKGKSISQDDVTIAGDVIGDTLRAKTIDDVADFSAIYSGRIFGRNMLGYDFSDKEILDITNAYAGVLQPKIRKSILNDVFTKGIVPTMPWNKRKIEGALNLFRSAADKIITNALDEMSNKDQGIDNYVTRLIESVHDADQQAAGQDLSAEQYDFIASQVIIMLAGGIEAPRAQLFWALNYIARHPDIQDELRAEALSAEGVTDYQNTLAYRIFKEATRLQSPVYAMLKDDPDAQKTYFIPLTALHFNSAYWGNDVNQFDPDRMLNDDNPAAAFLAFGQGPHGCPGMHQAYKQNISALYAFMQAGLVLSATDADMPLPRISFLVQPPQNSSLELSRSL